MRIIGRDFIENARFFGFVYRTHLGSALSAVPNKMSGTTVCQGRYINQVGGIEVQHFQKAAHTQRFHAFEEFAPPHIHGLNALRYILEGP